MGKEFICREEMFLRQSLTRSGRGITALLTTNSTFSLHSAMSPCRKLTLSSLVSAAISEATRSFLATRSTRWKCT